MSYAVSTALQAAVYQRLVADSTLSDLVGDVIFDSLPPGAVPALYVALGPEKVRDASDGSGGGAWHEFIVSVVSKDAGFAQAKTVAGAICDALVNAPLILTRGRLVGLHFRRAAAARTDKGRTRRIDLTFRARVQDS